MELQNFVQRDAFVLKQMVPGRYCDHQRITPYSFRNYAFAHFIRLRETYVVQIVLQTLYLLR